MARDVSIDRSKRAKSHLKPASPTRTTPRREAAATEPKRNPASPEDTQRSDWEGMTPKPEQPSDDVATPGQLPESDS